MSASRAVPVYGDMTAKKLGVSADVVKKLKGHINHVYHLAAVYDLKPPMKSRRFRSTSKARATWSSLPRPSTLYTCTT